MCAFTRRVKSYSASIVFTFSYCLRKTFRRSLAMSAGELALCCGRVAGRGTELVWIGKQRGAKIRYRGQIPRPRNPEVFEAEGIGKAQPVGRSDGNSEIRRRGNAMRQRISGGGEVPLASPCNQAAEQFSKRRHGRFRVGIAEPPGEIRPAEVVALKAELLRGEVISRAPEAVVAEETVARRIDETRSQHGRGARLPCSGIERQT